MLTAVGSISDISGATEASLMFSSGRSATAGQSADAGALSVSVSGGGGGDLAVIVSGAGLPSEVDLSGLGGSLADSGIEASRVGRSLLRVERYEPCSNRTMVSAASRAASVSDSVLLFGSTDSLSHTLFSIFRLVRR